MASGAGTDGAAAVLADLRPGDLVEVAGLKAAELNGLQGLLLRWDSSSGRWDVKLPEGEAKAIRPEHLAYRAVAPVEDDGTLVLVGMATEHTVVQRVLRLLGDELPKVNEALQLAGHVISPRGGAAAQGADASLWLKLARQAEQRVRGALEDLQRHIEAMDSVDAASTGTKSAGDFRVARKDLVRFVQSAQERLEGIISRLQPVLRRLALESPAEPKKRKHGWSEEDGLHEKYPELAEHRATRNTSQEPKQEGQSNINPIIVKYQGRGENPSPSDNLYLKALPGWITEEDLRAIFSVVGEVQSMKLKAADWGAIAFVRLASKSEATKAIHQLNGKIPPRLAQRAEEQQAGRLEEAKAKATLQTVVEQLERGVLVIFSLLRPLGITFDDHLFAIKVEEGSQAAEAGICRGWRVRSLGGRQLESTNELKKGIESLKKKGAKSGVTQASLAFAPPPLVVKFDKRPFGFTTAHDPSLGLVFVTSTDGQAECKGIQLGSVLTMVEGQDVSSLDSEDVLTRLQGASLPVELVFERAHVCDSRGQLSHTAAEAVVELSDESDEEVEVVSVPADHNGRGPQQVEITLSLSQPLGIGFDDSLVAKEVKERTQADTLGIRRGWRAVAVNGESVSSTKELVARLQKRKAEGGRQISVVFSPSSTAGGDVLPDSRAGDEREAKQKPRISTSQGDAGGGVLPDSRAEDEREAKQKPPISTPQGDAGGGVLPDSHAEDEGKAKQEPPISTSQGASCDVEVATDLSQPLGVFFDDFLVAKAVKDSSQAERLGIRSGWRALAVAGEPVSTTKELVAKVQGHKKQGRSSVCILFSPSAPKPGGETCAHGTAASADASEAGEKRRRAD